MCACVCMSVFGALESGAEAEEAQYNVTSKSYGVIWNTKVRMTDCPHSVVCITLSPSSGVFTWEVEMSYFGGSSCLTVRTHDS